MEILILLSLFGWFFIIMDLRRKIHQNDGVGPTSHETSRDLAGTANHIRYDLERRLGPDYEVKVKFNIDD